MNICIICTKGADQKGSHIIPLNLIKECVGDRDNEISYEVDLINGNQEIFIGKNLRHKSEEINYKNLKITDQNHYTLDFLLCKECEKNLGVIEGKVYTEIICKIREEKFKNNFETITINNFDVLIPLTKRITTDELNIYFYSIILRVLYYLETKNIKLNIDKSTIDLMSKYVQNLIYNSSTTDSYLTTGLIVYVTNNTKSYSTMLETDKFEKLIIPVCNFVIILECTDNKTLFGDSMNYITDKKFKFIKNSALLDKYVFNLLDRL